MQFTRRMNKLTGHANARAAPLCSAGARTPRRSWTASRQRCRAYFASIVLGGSLALADSPWHGACAAGYDIEVKKSERMLIVRDGDHVRAKFQIALGRGGPGDKQKLGDNKTPVGVYRIVEVKDKTRFDTFMRLNYPNVKDAFYGLKNAVISRPEFDRIVQALRHGQVPPQNTRLGGAIGIHGLTEESPEALHIQAKLNWTEGCIALKNGDLHELRPFIDVGTRVVISE